MPNKRKSSRLRLDRKRYRKEEEFYNVFTLENTEIPILRGEEALTGKKMPAYELPANKKILYEFGNMFTTKKPKLNKKSKNKFIF